MPLYEYQCEACGQRFEIIQKFSEASDTCRLCGKGPVQRLASSPAIQFKGSGFYITDYSQKGKAPASESSGDSGTQGKESGKSESDKSANASSSTSDAAKPAAKESPSPTKSDASSKSSTD